MDNLQLFRHQVKRYTAGLVLVENCFIITLFLLGVQFTTLPFWQIAVGSLLVSVLACAALTILITNYTVAPLQALWQAILLLDPDTASGTTPDPHQLRAGQELATTALAQLNQLATVATKAANEARVIAADPSHNFIAQNLPLPLLLLDGNENIIFANASAAQYIGIDAANLAGKNVYMVLDMAFPSSDTFDGWLKEAKSKSATAVNSWERVRLNPRDNHPLRLFDLAAYFNRENPTGIETMLVLFDHTKQYSQDDQAVSFIALTVHELRTPLTLLRGYIEVFEDELPTTDPELRSFMEKMRSQAEQLTAFVNNILNVARVDNDQLELHLQEEDWAVTLTGALQAISLRAKVRGIQLRCNIMKGLPTVGVDRLSIYEVINNLVDNAIKYSGGSKVIEINTYLTQDGLVETTVRDYGLGISRSIVPNLFTKFYRDHRNRAQIGGTGLGLYLSKAIVDAHGGNIWVRSKEKEGSTFGFTLIPYAQLAKELKQTGNSEITRGAHGWIKNHSLYRR